MNELEFNIMHLVEYDVYCLMIKDMDTGKYFKSKEYERLLGHANIQMRSLKK
jgi:hypothetical protein